MASHQLREPSNSFLTLTLSSEAETRQLAEDIALILKPGDVLCLSGDLGAGKSTFSRALIRNVAADYDLEVPSPTFTLVQPYDLARLNLSHFDLYRLEEPEELEELGLEELLEDGAALIEWPEKAEELLPDSALWLQFQHGDDEDTRQAVFFSEDPVWQERLEATLEIRAFLDETLEVTFERHHLAGDASLRTFERIDKGGESLVLMRWPFSDAMLPEPVRAYMDKVHLAKDCRSVAAVGQELRKAGIHAPAIKSADFQNGLVLSEYLGSETIVIDGKPVPERYFAAVDVLAAMHAHDFPETVQLDTGDTYQVPLYSIDALIAEASLFLDWYVPEMTGEPASEHSKAEFEILWRQALDACSTAQTGWVLRDFHSPNLLWQEQADGTDRIGIIDFQDTVIGPVAYDVASLLLDARTDIDASLENALYDAYVKARTEQSDSFDSQAFSNAYSIMAAQRITKILGIFVRLARRDGKSAYLGHLPRMEAYLDRVLASPVLSDLKKWYQQYRA
ncbi:tRNA (adenosine(37)-N6)-threonylcarbamoyltransferase complex ATPase subunit type 1 TsaE [Labrenzia sp. PHM005]|uniref:tRNA (adenosine(37)-N6)-threonylcarbamoyltransferase complex ATPase subunit type 1 TsaE n=1 Tax=Labrenzia sp. PHM005 TaxID=2590016 RepID=UPI001140568D|nr:tRNA (adenosine(37)-N6)-threonylcarbamoyltransferase complex ATPase subunit type 1 TsaE [Labrenzia sp. PHM005]QDG74653.1 tRNA (adenosine(37)-N6)-threonylcarbamoyltransferase complex ATPase subunit type 1 TsaE [Labrenzia sp. PHM005]